MMYLDQRRAEDLSAFVGFGALALLLLVAGPLDTRGMVLVTVVAIASGVVAYRYLMVLRRNQIADAEAREDAMRRHPSSAHHEQLHDG